MKGMFGKLLILCLVALFLTSVNGIAQESRVGTNAAPELLIPVGARYIAMGGASAATVKGVEAIFWNPAGLARSDYNADAMFSHVRHIADININYAAVGLRFGNIGTFGFSVKAMDIGDIPITTEFAPDGTGGVLEPQFITAGFSYSRALTDRISIGATFNFINETLDRVSARGTAFDFGVQYRGLADIEGLSLAVAIKNLGPGMSYSGAGLLREAEPTTGDRGSSPFQIETQEDELPSLIVIGASYAWQLGELSTLEIVSTYQDNNFEDDAGNFGAEFNYNDLFFVRAGYGFAPNAADDVYIYGLTAGAGIHYDFSGIGITVDYAYRQTDFFDAGNTVSLKLGF